MPPSEAWEFAVTIPAGTPASAPVTVPTTLPTRRITAIRWRVPQGAKGLMGWRVTMSGVQVVPAGAGTWMITDGQSGTWELKDQPDSGAWQVMGYNTGAFNHLVYVTYMAELVTSPPVPPMLAPGGVLGPAPDLSLAGPPVRGRL